MQIRHIDRDKPIQRVEEKFQLRFVRIEDVSHFVLAYDLPKNAEGHRLVLHDKDQEASEEIHSLTVLHSIVDHGLSVQDVQQIFGSDGLVLHRFKRTVHIDLDLVSQLVAQSFLCNIKVLSELCLDVITDAQEALP